MTGELTVVQADSGEAFKDFIKLPWEIYKNNPYWVPPLISEMKKKLNPEIHPFFKHSQVGLFVAYYQCRPVGRIAAIIDFNHNHLHQDKVGFFGLFETIENYAVAETLLNKAKQWLRNRNMNVMRGPINLSMNDECGFLLEEFDSPPVFMMPYNPEYYLHFMEKYGMVKAKDLYAYLNEGIIKTPEHIEKIAKRAREKYNVKIRHADFKKLDEEIQKIKDIYNAAWEKNWGFVPMTDEEMDYMAAGLKKIAEPELVLFAEVDGKPVGVAVTVPNYNEVLIHMNGRLDPMGIAKFIYYRKKIKGLRSLIMGMLKEYRLTGIPVLLFTETAKAARKLGYEWCETSWNLEDNHLINKFDETIGGRLYKKYRIYEKEI